MRSHNFLSIKDVGVGWHFLFLCVYMPVLAGVVGTLPRLFCIFAHKIVVLKMN